jgi:hypothetical protein
VKYDPGDVLTVYYPFREDPARFTRRPALFIRDNKNGTYKMCQITRTNRTGEIKGEWIDKSSKEYKEMGLKMPSFINLENILDVPKSMVLWGPIGKYEDIERLLELYNIH